MLKQKDSRFVGIYKIRYRATLDSYPDAPPIELEAPFTVTIVQPPSPSVYVFNVIPDWMSVLKDQYVTQGESLIYSFGPKTNFFGTETTVNVRMKKAVGLFASYDSIWNSFVVNGTNIEDN